MRRSRAPLTAWPAFADLMTILAVVSLAVAAVVLGDSGDGGDRRMVAKLQRQIAQLRHQLDDANETIAKQRARIRELELRVMFPSGLPCLWNSGPPITIVPLLRIVVASDYVITPLWPPERSADVAAIPQLANAIKHGQMDVEEFEQYSNAIYRHGDRADTFDHSCRFYVELKQGGTEMEFSRAVGVVSQYFLISNPGEVNRILRGEQ